MSGAALFLCISTLAYAQIDRYAVVSRHNVRTTSLNVKSPAQVGNGKFAFGMDVTGLQTFVSFNTLSDWGWHSEPLPEGKTVSDYKPVYIRTYKKNIPYILSNPEEKEISDWLRCNPHRIDLARIGFVLKHDDGSPVTAEDLADPVQEINLWTGLVSSSFKIDGQTVSVRTSCHPERDMIAVSVTSDLIASGRLQVFIDLPYADLNNMAKQMGDFTCPEKHNSAIVGYGHNYAVLRHSLDSTTYDVALKWDTPSTISRLSDESHKYVLAPSGGSALEFTCCFSPESQSISDEKVAEVEAAYAAFWKEYWMSGAAVDMSGSRDPRWRELERRVVLSQYVMRLNETGLYPPQESGLVNNGWYGRFHWEMIWWHGVHFGLWDRMKYIDRYLSRYADYMPEAIARASTEGRRGAKWPKCTADFNREWPCAPHAMLCWQQPHPIYFAEMEYRMNPTQEVLDKWKDVVINTADYMADYVFRDKARRRYNIGPPVVPVSENTPYMETLNPIFEVGYFRYGLRTALDWADRLELPSSRVRMWKKVLSGIAELPQDGGLYTTYEGIPDMWTKYTYEHPGITGVYGMLPGDGVDIDTFRLTFDKIQEVWQFDKMWGWDYAMMAMAAARLGKTSRAVELLTTTAPKFAFDVHGLADMYPYPYFPANGGLLTAVAMMCAGWEGAPEGQAPGFPDDGSWVIKYEGFNVMQ